MIPAVETAPAGQPSPDRPGRRPGRPLAVLLAAPARARLGGRRGLGRRRGRVRRAGEGAAAREGHGDGRQGRGPGLPARGAPTGGDAAVDALGARGSAGDPAPAGRRRLRRRARHRTSVRCADRRPARGRRHAARGRAPRPLGRQPGLRSWRPGAAPARSRGSRTARRRSSASRPRRSQTCRRGIPAARVEEIPNGFEPALVAMRKPQRRRHDDPPLRDAHEGPAAGAAAAGARAAAPARAPWLRGAGDPRARSTAPAPTSSSSRRPAGRTPSRRIADADVALVTQARGAGDETAVAAKVYEYLALGKPVLCDHRRWRDRGAPAPPRRRPAHGAARRPLVDRGRAREDRRRRPTATRAAGEARPVRAAAPSPAPGRAARRARLATSPSTSTIRSAALPSHSGGILRLLRAGCLEQCRHVRDPRRVEAEERVRPHRDRDRPLRVRAQREARQPEVGRLLLDPARVGERARRAGDEAQELDVADGLEQLQPVEVEVDRREPRARPASAGAPGRRPAATPRPPRAGSSPPPAAGRRRARAGGG